MGRHGRTGDVVQWQSTCLACVRPRIRSLSLEGAERSEREEKLAVWKVGVIFNIVQI